MRLRSLSVFAASASLAAVTVGAAALATGTATAAAARPASHVVFAPVVGKYALSNWGGYAATGTFTSASADWTIPKVTCLSSSDLYAPWVGIDGYSSQTVEQTGVQTSCSSGTPEVSAWYEMYPASPVYWSNAASIGDKFSASVTYTGGKFVIKITDITKKWSHTISKTLAGATRASAEAVIEAPGGYPKFTALKFTDVKFNGKDLSTFKLNKLDSGSSGVTYHPSAVTDGTNFSMLP